MAGAVLGAGLALRERSLRDGDTGAYSDDVPVAGAPLAPLPGSGFLIGANYEGPADRSWAMWAEGRFDAALIETDFGRATDAGLGALRIFVQEPLAGRIEAGEWQPLDIVMDLAERRGLGLIVALADYRVEALNALAGTATAIARRYADHPALRGYDLRNEPRVGDLITALYPDGPIRLQSAAALEHYGALIPRDSALAWRAGQPSWLPARLSDDEAHWTITTLLAMDHLQAESRDWIAERPGATVLEYLDEPEARVRWSPLVGLIDSGLRRWMGVQTSAIRAFDQQHPIMVGYNDPLLASLPANRLLDLVSFHHYLPPDDAAPAYMASVASQIGARVERPVLLGEFGWSTAEVPAERAAELEVESFRVARRAGLAGGLKWMLNDAANQPDAREAAFGMYRADGTAKAVVAAMRGLTGFS